MRDEFLLLTPQEQEEFLAGLDLDTLEAIAREEWFWVARPEQIPPEGNWMVHMVLSGRGFGKSRSGSEWIVQRCLEHPYDSSGFPTERMVMAYSLSDARAQCIEGPSGILRVLERRGFKPMSGNRLYDSPVGLYNYVRSPKPMIILLETETKIHFSGADPDAARGFNLADVWLDELAKWTDGRQIWREGILPALRADILGDKPRAFVTTTPKPNKLLQEWLEDTSGKYSIIRGSTFDNAVNLSQDFIEEIQNAYGNSALGRQELYGEMLDANEGVLFSYEAIQTHRVDIGPEQVAHRVVAVDPGLTGNEDGDEMGVVVACRDNRDHIYVVADKTIRSAGREAALHIWHVFETYQCDTVVYEANIGKAWMHQVLTDAYAELQRAGLFPAESTPPLVAVHSQQGKKTRAEPVAMRYSQGRVHHIGTFDKLENQLLTFDPLTSRSSPDRLDALVHACRHLMEGERRRSKIISPRTFLVNSPQEPVSGW